MIKWHKLLVFTIHLYLTKVADPRNGTNRKSDNPPMHTPKIYIVGVQQESMMSSDDQNFAQIKFSNLPSLYST